MSMKGMGGLNHKYQQRPTSYTNNPLSLSGPREHIDIRLELHPYGRYPL
jgi:hypothetical protein